MKKCRSRRVRSMSKFITEEHPDFHIIWSESGKDFIVCNRIKELNALIDVVDRIINGKEPPYETLHGNLGELRQPTKFGLSLGAFNGYRSLYDGDLSYAPGIQLFFDCVKNYPYPFWDHPSESNFFAEHVCKFVDAMREEGKKINIKKKIADWIKGPQNNSARLTSCLDSLFEHFPQILVVRLDLHHRQFSSVDFRYGAKIRSSIETERVFRRSAFYSGSELPKTESVIERTSLKEIKADYKKWFDNARNKTSLFSNLIWHVVRYRFSKGAGYHIHVTLFFNGSKGEDTSLLPDKIGKYWVETTDGRGNFLNCNLESYSKAVIKGATCREGSKRDDLYRALVCLAEEDMYVRVKSGKKQKLFSMGRKPVAQVRTSKAKIIRDRL